MRTHLLCQALLYRAFWTLGFVVVSLSGPTRAAPQNTQEATPSFVVTAPWALEGNYHPVRTEPAPKWTPPVLSEAAPPLPLSAEQQVLVQSTKQETLPEPTWARYVMSNEWRHDVLFPKLAGLGGVFVGVATDQNYTMAAAARAELLVTMDYDSDVVMTHRIYHHFIGASPTAEELRSYYTEGGAQKAMALLDQVAKTQKEAAHLKRVYLRYRQRLAIYLHQVAKLRVGARRPTWLGDPTAYSYIRSLVKGGRVRAVQGDLNGTTTLRSIGETARALKLPIRAVYTSNAEGFFSYSQALKESLASLPHDEKTVIVRTYKRGMAAPEGDLWHYNVHKLDDFLLRSATPGYPNVAAIMTDMRTTQEGRKRIEPVGVSYYDEGVPKAQTRTGKTATPSANKTAIPITNGKEKASSPLAARL